MKPYYRDRANYDYYRMIRNGLDKIGPKDSILDIGCWDTPVATWGNFVERYTIDPRERPSLDGVTAIVGSWPEDAGLLPASISVITCLQMLEHMENPKILVDKMFEVATDYIIISVPHQWPAGKCKYHVKDPVDIFDVLQWAGMRKPKKYEITGMKAQRLLCYWKLS